jgi:hypothetical protein
MGARSQSLVLGTRSAPCARVYAPALVGWTGTHGASVSWFPLGPREVYVPAHRYSRHYVERVNVSNTIVNRMLITQAYENRGANFNYRNRVAPGGVTTASRSTFTSAGASQVAAFAQTNRERHNLSVSAVAPQIAPSREGRLGAPTRAKSASATANDR